MATMTVWKLSLASVMGDHRVAGPSTITVMRIAITPSLNASIRLVGTTRPPTLFARLCGSGLVRRSRAGPAPHLAVPVRAAELRTIGAQATDASDRTGGSMAGTFCLGAIADSAQHPTHHGEVGAFHHQHGDRHERAPPFVERL